MEGEDPLIVSREVWKSRVEKLDACDIQCGERLEYVMRHHMSLHSKHIASNMIAHKNASSMSKTCSKWSAIGTHCLRSSVIFDKIRNAHRSRSMDENDINVSSKVDFITQLLNSVSEYGADLRQAHSWYYQRQRSQWTHALEYCINQT